MFNANRVHFRAKQISRNIEKDYSFFSDDTIRYYIGLSLACGWLFLSYVFSRSGHKRRRFIRSACKRRSVESGGGGGSCVANDEA